MDGAGRLSPGGAGGFEPCANCGPKAFRVLAAAGIKVFLGATGTVGEAVAAFKEGRLAEAAEANVEGHW
ncbi:MAG: hypothetical protein FJ288_00475 [Planctomycetes bacterium]|nr:hypothetical protein [Planctomycetota bacterium]